MSEFFKKNWLTIIVAFSVFVGSSIVTIKLSFTSKIYHQLGTVFFLALYFSGIYEISIKERIKAGYKKGKIISEIILVWVIPLLLGYGLSLYLITTG